MSQAEPVYVPLEPPDFGFDPDRLRRAVSPRTRAIIFNSPNNPTGKIFSRAELQIIADLCIEHDLLAITDEIYEHILYDGVTHTPIATLPGMADRTITISGISKSYSVTGWRVGYAVASPELSLGIRRAHDFITVGAPHPYRRLPSPLSTCPMTTTSISGKAIRRGVTCSSPRWRKPASGRTSHAARTTS
jgi:aminotransferase